MTALAFVIVAVLVGAVGVAVGIIVAPVLTRAADRISADQEGGARSRDDDRA